MTPVPPGTYSVVSLLTTPNVPGGARFTGFEPRIEVKSSVIISFRWTIKADCLKSILKNYGELLLLWDRSLAAGVSDTDMKARILGVQSQMSKFSFLMCKS